MCRRTRLRRLPAAMDRQRVMSAMLESEFVKGIAGRAYCAAELVFAVFPLSDASHSLCIHVVDVGWRLRVDVVRVRQGHHGPRVLCRRTRLRRLPTVLARQRVPRARVAHLVPLLHGVRATRERLDEVGVPHEVCRGFERGE